MPCLSNWLLRARHKRPRRRTPNQSNDLSTPHENCPASSTILREATTTSSGDQIRVTRFFAFPLRLGYSDENIRPERSCARGQMDRQLLELSLIAAFSGFLCGIAFYQGNLIGTAAFAALTCAAGVIAMELRRFR
jgi:hypothetical protein